MDSKQETAWALVIFGILFPPAGVLMLGAVMMGAMLSLFAMAATYVFTNLKDIKLPTRTVIEYLPAPQTQPQLVRDENALDLSLLDPMEREALEERKKRLAAR